MLLTDVNKVLLTLSYFIRRQKNDANDTDIDFIPTVALIELEWHELNRKLIFMIFSTFYFSHLVFSIYYHYLLMLFNHYRTSFSSTVEQKAGINRFSSLFVDKTRESKNAHTHERQRARAYERERERGEKNRKEN